MVSTILGICGSPRKAATLKALEIALEAAGEAGAGEVETELVFFKGRKISPCNHCNACKRNGGTCIIEDDMKPLYEKVLKADGFVFASPVYAMNMTPQLSAFFSRLRPLHDETGGKLRNRIATGIAVGGKRNGGQENTISNIIHACMTRGIVYIGGEPGFYSGAMIWSRDKGADWVQDDPVGLDALLHSGRRIAYWTRLVAAGKGAVPEGEVVKSRHSF
jgi:multimeric flavodoxin WrbA